MNFIDGIEGPKFKRRDLYTSTPESLAKEYKEKEYPSFFERPRTKNPWRFLIYPFIIILIILNTFSSNVIFSSSSLLDNLTSLKPAKTLAGIWSSFKKIIKIEEKTLIGEKEDRINILLLGQGGVGHEGPYLTDTLMLASLKPSTNQVAFLSVPRDLYVPIYGNSWRKINYANAFGEVEKGGQGGEIASQTISNILGLPVPYYIRVDFEGFEKAIDDLGGLDIYVEKSFTDPLFPNSNYGTTTVTFNQGQQKMNGSEALKYARSRHGDNGEGSDFARSKRQQKIIIALKDKYFSLGSLFQPQKFIKATKDFKDHLKTNLETWEILRLINISRDIDLGNAATYVLDDSPDGLLEAQILEDGAYVLRPKTGDFNQIASLAQSIFEESPLEKIARESREEPRPEAKPKPEIEPEVPLEPQPEPELEKVREEAVPQEPIKLIIQNGTWIEGLAKKTADRLTTLGYEVLRSENAYRQNFEKTLIYNLTDELNLEELEKLQELFGAEVTTSSPDFLIGITEADFLIILGSSAQEEETVTSTATSTE